MNPCFYRRLMAVLCLLSVAAVASAQPLNWFWWKSEPSLALTPEQSTQIDGVFQEGIARLMQQKDELDRLEGKLSRLIETMADEGQVSQQIDRVEAVRSTLNKTRTLMLLHMRQVLKPEQRLKLNALRDRRVTEQQLLRDKDKAGALPDTGKRSDGARKPSH
jgi:Spy/CpxP family protein refolding chaperone